MRPVRWSVMVSLLACATARADIRNPLIWPHDPGTASSRFGSLLTGGWAATIAIETVVLAVLLSARHGWRVRLFAGVWLSACTLPLVWLVLPELLPAGIPSAVGVLATETLAPLVECGLFWWACIRPRPTDARATVRDCIAIVAANLASFVAGEAAWRWLGLA